MQKLHLVGITTDHGSLILGPTEGGDAETGQFTVEIDDALREAVAEALATRGPDARRSALGVREIQARLRAGESVRALAAEAGVGVSWIERFAPPVEAERARVIELARAATMVHPTHGPSADPLAASVYRNLVGRGVRASAAALDQGWLARQVADGRWVVTLPVRIDGKPRRASWELDLEAPAAVRPADRLATDLGYVDTATPRGRSRRLPSSPGAAPAGGSERPGGRLVPGTRPSASAGDGRVRRTPSPGAPPAPAPAAGDDGTERATSAAGAAPDASSVAAPSVAPPSVAPPSVAPVPEAPEVDDPPVQLPLPADDNAAPSVEAAAPSVEAAAPSVEAAAPSVEAVAPARPSLPQSPAGGSERPAVRRLRRKHADGLPRRPRAAGALDPSSPPPPFDQDAGG